MDAREEQIFRLALKRRRKLGSLSDEGFAELELAVREDPARFVDDSEEEAFALVAQALSDLESSRATDELLDDEQFEQARSRRMERLARACGDALSCDPACTDARLLLLLSSSTDLDVLLDGLIELERNLEDDHGPLRPGATGDCWADVFLRPRLRVMAQVAQNLLYSGRYRMCCDTCGKLLEYAPLDVLGARLSYALALARLEDEEGFNWLDAHEGRHGNAWFHLSRVILMYKLGRTSAARRALSGYDRLCTGGAYALLQPHFVDTYLPDRPAFEPGSFEEAMLAVHEADVIVCDVPDFRLFCRDQPAFLDSARTFCEQNGLDWNEW